NRLAVIHERTRSDGQTLFLTQSHVSHLSGDDFGHVAHPTFFNIQRQHPYRSIVLTLYKIADDGRRICFRWVRLDISLTGPTEVTQDEVQVLLGHKGYRVHDAVLCVDRSGSSLVSALESVNIGTRPSSYSVVVSSSIGPVAKGALGCAVGPVVVTSSTHSSVNSNCGSAGTTLAATVTCSVGGSALDSSLVSRVCSSVEHSLRGRIEPTGVSSVSSRKTTNSSSVTMTSYCSRTASTVRTSPA